MKHRCLSMMDVELSPLPYILLKVTLGPHKSVDCLTFVRRMLSSLILMAR